MSSATCNFQATQVCEQSTMILESIWQEILSFLTSLTSILRPVEWMGLSSSIKLFKAMQQMLLMLLTIPHNIFLFKKIRSGVDSQSLLSSPQWPILWKVVFTWYPINSQPCNCTKTQRQQALHLTPKCKDSFFHFLSILMPTHIHISVCSCFAELPKPRVNSRHNPEIGWLTFLQDTAFLFSLDQYKTHFLATYFQLLYYTHSK